MTRFVFEEVKQRGVKIMRCTACGKRQTRTRTFTNTLSPWNVNPDGSVCTLFEVRQKLWAKQAAWQAEPEPCRFCGTIGGQRQQ